MTKNTGLSLYRPAQEDLTVSVAENLIDKDTPAQLTGLILQAKATPTIRRFEFSSPDGKQYAGALVVATYVLTFVFFWYPLALHAFEEAVTGFKVLFDGYVYWG